MGSWEIIFILLFAAVLLIGIAQKIQIPYPIILVLGGTVLGFIPVLQTINLDSNVILLLFLPPILYYASFGIDFREFQKNWREIFSLALGLVVFTTLLVGILFKWMFPEFSWALCFAFGAIISPPDAIAATTILKRFAISPRLVALLEGESLINDASAIVLYKLALTALLSGTFSLMDGGKEFLQAVIGGIMVGFALGFLLQYFSKNYLSPILGVVFSFTIPYITFIIATYLEVSGVLAVVVNGLIGSRILYTHHSSLRRVLGFAAWDIFIILLNCFVFILIGLQLGAITQMLTAKQMLLYVGYALLIALSMVIARLAWVYARVAITYITALKAKKTARLAPQMIREAAIIAWSGMRGIVSLALAISLPYSLSQDGMPLEGRNEVIFITFFVILATLLVPGLSLPLLIRSLKIHSVSEKNEEKKVREQLEAAVNHKLHALLNADHINKEEYEFLRHYFHSHSRILEIAHSSEQEIKSIELARRKVIEAQRKAIFEMWKQEEINDRTLMHFENELDVIEIHIARAEL